jgi:enamine deaminase RidA (YjgF/YER057c/UK114 family)
MFDMVRRAGDLLFVNGMVGRTPEGPVVEGGIRPQTRRCLERIEEVLAGEGRDRSHIVRCRFFVTDMRQWPEAREEVDAFFGDRCPPSTALGITALVEPGMLIEIEVEASAA